jgi:hypothetical protein
LSLLEETDASGVAQADYIYLNGRPMAVLNGPVAPVSVIVPNHVEGAPGPSLLGTGEGKDLGHHRG